MLTKICRVCWLEKPLEAFYRDNRKIDGRWTMCKSCHIHRDHGKYRRVDTPVTPKAVATFLRRVDKINACWLWTACTDKDNYGRWSKIGYSQITSRASYELFTGPIPEGRFVCHTCVNPRCVRPDHLFLGTAGDNARDRQEKGRGYTLTHDTRGEGNGGAKLNEATIIEIRRATKSDLQPGTIGALAKEHGVNFSTMWKVVTGRSWQHVA